MAAKASKKIDIEGLKKEIPFKFKPQSVKYGKALLVSYIDSRDAQDLLDECVGPENWQDNYQIIGDNLYGGVGINITGDPEKENWVWKWDCGTESNTEQEKGQASDAFKRACVKWGIGRFLYRQKIIELKTAKDSHGKERPATDDGKILWNPDDITKYIRDYKLSHAASKKTSGDRYSKPIETPTYSTPNWSEDVVEKVKKLEKNGKKGKECLTYFLPKYNEAKGSEYKLIAELGTDDLLNGLIDFIENTEPEGI